MSLPFYVKFKHNWKNKKFEVVVKCDTKFIIRPPHPSISATYVCILVTTKYAEI